MCWTRSRSRPRSPPCSSALGVTEGRAGCIRASYSLYASAVPCSIVAANNPIRLSSGVATARFAASVAARFVGNGPSTSSRSEKGFETDPRLMPNRVPLGLPGPAVTAHHEWRSPTRSTGAVGSTKGPPTRSRRALHFARSNATRSRARRRVVPSGSRPAAWSARSLARRAAPVVSQVRRPGWGVGAGREPADGTTVVAWGLLSLGSPRCRAHVAAVEPPGCEAADELAHEVEHVGDDAGLGLGERIPQTPGAAEGALDVAAEVGGRVGLGIDRTARGGVHGRLALGALHEPGQEPEVVRSARLLAPGDREPGDAGAVGADGLKADQERVVALGKRVEGDIDDGAHGSATGLSIQRAGGPSSPSGRPR